MRILSESTPEDPAADMELTGRLLAEVARDRGEARLRLFVPGPTVALGRLDRLAPGYPAARATARAAGYVPLLRHGGGHAVVYDRGCVVLELIRSEGSVIGQLEPRFREMTELMRGALADLDVATELGELPGEYCPGQFSLHLPGGPKVAGVAQRIIRGASLTTAVLTVAAGPVARTLTQAIYADLGLELDPATVGAISDRHPNLGTRATIAALVTRAESLTG